MKILVTLRKRKTRRYLINLFTKSLIREVRHLIAMQDYSKAIDLVYREGLLEREILEDELHMHDADLMLSDTYARWDLTK